MTTWLAEDVTALHEMHSDPETMRYVRSGRPETRRETEDLLASYQHQQATRGWTKWRIADTQGEFVGRAGFGGAGDERELGYTIRRERWGHGLATEIAAALVRWHRAHRRDDGDGLWAFAAVENLASRRVLDKTGFTFVRFTEHNDVPCALYSLG